MHKGSQGSLPKIKNIYKPVLSVLLQVAWNENLLYVKNLHFAYRYISLCLCLLCILWVFCIFILFMTSLATHTYTFFCPYIIGNCPLPLVQFFSIPVIMQKNSPKYHPRNFWFGRFASSAKIWSFRKFHLLHFRIIMMKFARSSWENFHIWTVLRIHHVDGAFEEEGSECHLQLLQGVVTWTIMVVALQSVSNSKEPHSYKKKRQLQTYPGQ